MPAEIIVAPATPAGLGRRAAVTLGAVALLVVGEQLPLPFIDWDVSRLLVSYRPAFHLFSPLALGVMPFFTAFLLVECAAQVLPRLRWRRNGSAGDRRPLTLAAWALAVALATMQGWSMALFMRTVRDPYGNPLLDYGLGNALGVTGMLVLGTIVAGSAAVLVSRRGLGNGFAVLFAVGAAETVIRAGQFMLWRPSMHWSEVGKLVVLALLVAVPLVVAHQKRHRSAGPHLPVPTCGLALVQVPAVLLAFPATLASWFPAFSPLAEALRSDDALYAGVRLVLAIGLALFLARVFCTPDAVLRAYRRAAPERIDEEAAAAVRGALSLANRRSLALVVGVVLVPTAVAVLGVPVPISIPVLFALAVLITVSMDLLGEVRVRAGGALVSARPLHRVYAVEPVLEALAAAGIHGFARTRYYRALFHFFAPYAPIEILVPPERAAEAEAICARIVVNDQVN